MPACNCLLTPWEVPCECATCAHSVWVKEAGSHIGNLGSQQKSEQWLTPPFPQTEPSNHIQSGARTNFIMLTKICVIMGFQSRRAYWRKISPSYTAALWIGMWNHLSTGLAWFGRVAWEWPLSKTDMQSWQPLTSISLAWALVPPYPNHSFLDVHLSIRVSLPVWPSFYVGTL